MKKAIILLIMVLIVCTVSAVAQVTNDTNAEADSATTHTEKPSSLRRTTQPHSTGKNDPVYKIWRLENEVLDLKDRVKALEAKLAKQ
jgi:hypothetical protein